MTTLNLDTNSAKYHIRAYQAGQLYINDYIFDNSILLTPNQLIEHYLPSYITELNTKLILPPLLTQPDLLLLGTGSELIFPPSEYYGHLINEGIGIEIMNTAAACRTFSVLCAEERNVAAALFIL